MSDDFDVTLFDPKPWGSQQRVRPHPRFKAALSKLVPLPEWPPPSPEREPLPRLFEPRPVFAPPPSLALPLQPEVPAVAHTWPIRRTFDLRGVLRTFALPIAGAVLGVVLALVYVALPTYLDTSVPALSTLVRDATSERVHGVANIDAPPSTPRAEVAEKPLRTIAHKARKASPAPSRARPIVVNTATPLGDLRVSKL